MKDKRYQMTIADISYKKRETGKFQKQKSPAVLRSDNTFSDTLVTGPPLEVNTPCEGEKIILSERTVGETSRCEVISSSACGNNHLLRRLFEDVEIQENSGNDIVNMVDETTKVNPQSSELCQMSFDSNKDATFNGCLPRANLLNGSTLRAEESSVLTDDCTKFDELVSCKGLHALPKITTSDVAINSADKCQSEQLQCQSLSMVAVEISPSKGLAILAADTPVSCYGLTYRQKQLKGYL